MTTSAAIETMKAMNALTYQIITAEQNNDTAEIERLTAEMKLLENDLFGEPKNEPKNTMYVIGRSVEFYCLWIMNEGEFETTYTYVQKLAKSLEAAEQKAFDMGIKFEVCEDVKGRKAKWVDATCFDESLDLEFVAVGYSKSYSWAEASTKDLIESTKTDTRLGAKEAAHNELVNRGFSFVEGDYLSAKEVLRAEQEKAQRGHHFTDKEKVELTVKLVSRFEVNGFYGTSTCQKFVTSCGKLVSYFGASPKPFEVGKTYNIKATVKHTEVNLYDETNLIRIKEL